jgi:hypothetical protein
VLDYLFLLYLRQIDSKIAIILKVILFSYIHISDTERNIKSKGQGSYFKKYRAHSCSYNIGNKTYTKVIVTTNIKDFSQVVEKVHLK